MNTEKNRMKKRPIQITLSGEKTATIDSRNTLNDLTGREWIQFTRSWFIDDGKPSEITREIELHPASFPPSLVEDFIGFFTKEGESVLDPFLGTGSTLVACEAMGRKGVGIEIHPRYAETARKRTGLPVITGDASAEVERLIASGEYFKLVITSPPYWNILRTKYDYTQKARDERGLDLYYTESPDDYGNINEYEEYLRKLTEFFKNIKTIILPGGHLVVIVQNVRDRGSTVPIAFDITRELLDEYQFQGERIWCQSQKTLRPYGYPYAFVSNVHHHYCLIFKNPDSLVEEDAGDAKKERSGKETRSAQ